MDFITFIRDSHPRFIYLPCGTEQCKGVVLLQRSLVRWHRCTQRLNQRRQILLDDLPNHIFINIHVIVHETIAHPNYFMPGDFRMGFLKPR